jgi:hypothetical protein
MSGFMTAAGADYLLHLFSGDQTKEIYHVALVGNQEPGLTTSGRELKEPTEASYTRSEVVNQSGNWQVQHGTLTNEVEISFPLATTDWGDIIYWAICDAPEGGSVLWTGEFTTAFYVAGTDQVTIPVGGVSVSLDILGWGSE